MNSRRPGATERAAGNWDEDGVSQIAFGDIRTGSARGWPWLADMVQKPSAGVVVDGTCAGLGVQVEIAVLHHQVPDDLERTTCGKGHGPRR